MQTFQIEKENIRDHFIDVTGEVCHHLTKVLRVQKGENLRFSDGRNYYCGNVSELFKDRVVVAIDEVKTIDDEPHLSVTLIQCLPRGDKMDQILQKATELGVDTVIPVESDHSQVRLKDHKKTDKQQRWQKVAAAAAEQCGRGVVPVIALPCSVKDALASLDDRCALIFCHERETETGFKTVAAALKKDYTKIALLIGPEGGFSENEAEMIIEAGGKAVTMGRRILRTETAGPAALAVLMYEFGEWEVNYGD